MTTDYNAAWDADTTVGGAGGAPLPARRWYTGTIETAELQPHELAEGGRAFVQVGDIADADTGSNEFATTDGGTYRIGNRKVFERIWLGYLGNNSETVNRIAVQQLKELGWAAGVAGLERVKGDDRREHIRFTNGAVSPEEVVAGLPGRRIKFFVSKHEEYNGNVNPKVGAWGRV